MAAERGHEMAKKKNGVVPLRVVVQRINRKLAAKGRSYQGHALDEHGAAFW